MYKQLLMISSLFIISLLTIYLTTYPQQDYQLEISADHVETLDLWTSDSAVIELVEEFHATQDSIKINTRYFHKQETLIEELYGAASIDQVPDIAEIHAHYGIYSFIQNDELKNLNADIPERYINDLLPGVKSRYSYDDQLWAWPIGASIPIIYYNQTLIDQYEQGNVSYIEEWDQLWDYAEELHEEIGNEDMWAFHTDMNMPWYLHTFLRQQGKIVNDHLTMEEITDGHFEMFDRVVNDRNLMPNLTHQLAISQFVEGEGLFLLAPYHKHSLINRLIAGSFELGILPAPGLETGEKNYVAGGSGLVVFDKEENDYAIKFITFVAEEQMSVQLSLAANYFPVRMSGWEEEVFHQFLRLNPEVRVLRDEFLQMEEVPVSKIDQDLWEHLMTIQENIESQTE